MAGIYIHIPYCRQACHYCDFHFSVKQETKNAFVNSLLREISLQKNYLDGEKIETIYFGGGTPSLLSDSELKKIFDSLLHHFTITSSAEITLEANPDDLSEEKLLSLKNSPINRLSIGVQSFFEKDLQWMNRAHKAAQALTCVKRAQDAGFNNITIDLMYGLPNSTNDEWEENIEQAFELNVQHLSCYSLTVEPRTALAHFIAVGKSKHVNEEQAAQQFEILMKKIKEHDWLHYEISNFATEEKFISQHNSSYWKGKKYLGLGPSAHSFNETSRQWNIANNHKYIESITNGIVPFEKEELTEVQKVNEQIMTRLRTIWGLKISDFPMKLSGQVGLTISDLLRRRSQSFIEDGLIVLNNGSLILNDRGKLIADKIILELMIDE
jgi:oxygen-independent coproporphyrinogen-3 oxidase